jgi:hypothetical protein
MGMIESPSTRRGVTSTPSAENREDRPGEINAVLGYRNQLPENPGADPH